MREQSSILRPSLDHCENFVFVKLCALLYSPATFVSPRVIYKFLLSYSPCSSGPSPILTYSNTNSGPEPPSKLQTEPVDFSSSQPPLNFSSGHRPPAPAFDSPLTSSVTGLTAPGSSGSVFPPVRCPSPDSDTSLARYRPVSGYPGTLTSPYDTLSMTGYGPSQLPVTSAYPSYQQPSYSFSPVPGYPAVSGFSSVTPVSYQPDPLSLAYTSASLASSAIPSPDSCLRPELG